MADHFTEIQIPQQKYYNSIPFPAALSPNPTTTPCSGFHLTEAIRTQKPFLDSLLVKSGAVLLRGYDVKTAKEFTEVVEAFGYEELSYLGAAAKRCKVVGRVFTANESPPDQKIAFHHEFVAQRAAELGIKLEWMKVGGVKKIIGSASAVWYDKSRQQKVWFVNMIGWDKAGNSHTLYTTFLDGTSLPADFCNECKNSGIGMCCHS